MKYQLGADIDIKIGDEQPAALHIQLFEREPKEIGEGRRDADYFLESLEERVMAELRKSVHKALPDLLAALEIQRAGGPDQSKSVSELADGRRIITTQVEEKA